MSLPRGAGICVLEHNSAQRNGRAQFQDVEIVAKFQRQPELQLANLGLWSDGNFEFTGRPRSRTGQKNQST